MPYYCSNAIEPTKSLPDELPSWLTVGQAAFILNIHPRDVRRHVGNGVLKALKVGGTKLVTTDSVRDLYALRLRPHAARNAA